jgi:DNA-binding transcriptional LysR family regulator
MEIRQLRYICAIAEHGSFRKASTALFIAQPALSQQILKLECEIGVKLFNRAKRPVELTPAGEAFVPRARKILADLDVAAAEAREFAGEFRGKLAIGLLQYLSRLELPDLLMKFGGHHPAVEIHLRLGNSAQLRELLLTDAVEAAVAHADGLDLPPQYAIEVLRSEELVVILGRTHHLADRRRVMVEDFEQLPFILFEDAANMQQTLRQSLSDSELNLKIALQTGDLETAISLVAGGYGGAVVPKSIAMREIGRVIGIPIGPVPLIRHVALVWNRDRYHSRALESLANYIRRSFIAQPPAVV